MSEPRPICRSLLCCFPLALVTIRPVAKRNTQDLLMVWSAASVACRYKPPPSACMPGFALRTAAEERRWIERAIGIRTPYQRGYPRETWVWPRIVANDSELGNGEEVAVTPSFLR